jgi:D-lactate dehydrogenase (cytochrome)
MTLAETIAGELAPFLGARLHTAQAVRDHHASTATSIAAQSPDLVAYPKNTHEVSQILKICHAHGFPVIAFGAGSSLEGQVNAPNGGISLDMSEMSHVLDICSEDLLAVVQPGITRKRLNEELRTTGLTFPIDPGADASIGGMASTRASGTNAVRYGTMADNVLSLECVLADGQIIRTGTRAKKSSAGYDLTHLMIGAEGTLGIITELTLKLRGIPDKIIGGMAQFDTIQEACSAVILAIQCGLDVARIELLDAGQIAACNAYSKLDLPVCPTLFFEFSGQEAGTDEMNALFRETALECGATAYRYAQDADERNRLWTARHDAYWAALAANPGKKGLSTDACVPISRLADCIDASNQDLIETGLSGTILGHVGDGNFHVVLCYDTDDSADVAKVDGYLSRMSMRAIEMGGTCTGEHGIGQGKRKYLRHEIGGAVDAMRAVKTALDPKGILNPGKIFM